MSFLKRHIERGRDPKIGPAKLLNDGPTKKENKERLLATSFQKISTLIQKVLANLPDKTVQKSAST